MAAHDYWIKMRRDLGSDPQVIAMAAALDVPEVYIVGALHAVWAWFDAHSRDGSVTGVTLVSLDRRATIDGFAREMVRVGWLEVIEAEGGDTRDLRLQIPRFGTHMGEGGRLRAENAARQRKSRTKRDNPVTDVTPVSHQSVTGVTHSRDGCHSFALPDSDSDSDTDSEDQPASATSARTPIPVRAGRKGGRSRVEDFAGWLAGEGRGLAPREILRRLDVRNPALDLLCAAAPPGQEGGQEGVTAESIGREWAGVLADIERGEEIRNPVGVLIRRLAVRCGVALPEGWGENHEALSEKAAAARLAQLRAQLERGRSVSIAMNGNGNGNGKPGGHTHHAGAAAPGKGRGT